MNSSKFRTKNKFGAKKRNIKQRGRAGGRKPSLCAPIFQSERSSDNHIIKPNDVNISSETCSFSSVERMLAVQSATERKFKLFSSLEDSFCEEMNYGNASTTTDMTKTTSAGYTELNSGYRLVAVDFIMALINSLACIGCGASNFDVKEKKQGLKSVFLITCMACSKDFKIPSSRKNCNENINEVNVLAVAAGRNSGMGYQTLCNFMGNFDIPRPMHLKTYQKTAKKVHDAAMAAVEANLQEVSSIVRDSYISEEIKFTGNKKDATVDIAVSFDGTWHKRGHTSLFGVGIAIDLLTGFVVDFACQSKYCHGCKIGPKLTDDNYGKWKEAHAENCQANFIGSSNAMEASSAVEIFGRSLSKFNMRYTTMLCDGDSKAYQQVTENNIYGSDCKIVKEDCINHVAKRMGTALRKIKQDEKLGGRGKLTNETIVKLQNYYGKALKDNAPNVDKMKHAVYSSLFHIVSTDEEPHHNFCPPGATSWCHYQRSLVDESQKRPHKPTLSKEVGEKLLPIYSRLTDEQLLQRCAKSKTQNANESFNALIWWRCPKTEFTSLQTLETAVAMAVLEHNKGAHGFFSLLSNLGIQSGEIQVEHADLKNKRRIDDCERSVSQNRKKTRKIRKLQAAKQNDKLEKQEGITYQAGGF